MSMASSKKPNPLALTSLNHISRNCANVEESVKFYEHVLGFIPIKRPGSFNFDGAWLFNHGISIHLLQAEGDELDTSSTTKKELNPRDDHISFQCEDLVLVEKQVQEHRIKYTMREVQEGGIMVEQLFFHDPDGFMIEVCNCEKLPVVPLQGPVACLRYPSRKRTAPIPVLPDTVTQQLQSEYSLIGNEQFAMCV